MLLLAMTQRAMPFVRGRKMSIKAILLTFLLILVHRADMQSFMPKVQPWRPPLALRQALARIPSPGCAMVVPAMGFVEEGAGEYLQTLHGRTMFYGYLSRQPKGVLERSQADPFYQAVVKVQQGDAKMFPPVSQADKPALVILMKASLKPGEMDRLAKFLKGSMGYARVYEDADVGLYATLRPVRALPKPSER